MNEYCHGRLKAGNSPFGRTVKPLHETCILRAQTEAAGTGRPIVMKPLRSKSASKTSLFYGEGVAVHV